MNWREAFSSAFYWTIVVLMVGLLVLSAGLSFYVPVIAMAWGVIACAVLVVSLIAIVIKVCNR